MEKIKQISEEIEKLIQEIRALNKVLFNVDYKFSYKLNKKKKEIWNKIEFLKNLKKAYILKKDSF